MRERVAACGRDPGDLGVVGSLVIGNGDGDPAEALAGVPAMVAAGVTDVRLHMSMAAPAPELTDRLAGLVRAFRAAVGREAAS